MPISTEGSAISVGVWGGGGARNINMPISTEGSGISVGVCVWGGGRGLLTCPYPLKVQASQLVWGGGEDY